MITFFVRGNITVWQLSSLTGLDSANSVTKSQLYKEFFANLCYNIFYHSHWLKNLCSQSGCLKISVAKIKVIKSIQE